MTNFVFDPDLFAEYQMFERKAERQVFAALILAMMAYAPNFPASEFFGLCVSGIDDDMWMPQDTPPDRRAFARSVMDHVMGQMLGQDPREYLKTHPARYERDV